MVLMDLVLLPLRVVCGSGVVAVVLVVVLAFSGISSTDAGYAYPDNHALCTNEKAGLPSCDFDDSQSCDAFTARPSQGSRGFGWSIGNYTDLGSNLEALYKDFPGGEENNASFLYVDNNAGSLNRHPIGSKATLSGHITNPNTKAVCVTFLYATFSVDGADTTPQITLYNRNTEKEDYTEDDDDGNGKIKDGGIVQEVVMGTLVNDTQGQWVLASFHGCVWKTSQLVFETERINSSSILAVSSIRVTEGGHHCQCSDTTHTARLPGEKGIVVSNRTSPVILRNDSTIDLTAAEGRFKHFAFFNHMNLRPRLEPFLREELILSGNRSSRMCLSFVYSTRCTSVFTISMYSEIKTGDALVKRFLIGRITGATDTTSSFKSITFSLSESQYWRSPVSDQKLYIVFVATLNRKEDSCNAWVNVIGLKMDFVLGQSATPPPLPPTTPALLIAATTTSNYSISSSPSPSSSPFSSSSSSLSSPSSSSSSSLSSSSSSSPSSSSSSSSFLPTNTIVPESAATQDYYRLDKNKSFMSILQLVLIGVTGLGAVLALIGFFIVVCCTRRKNHGTQVVARIETQQISLPLEPPPENQLLTSPRPFLLLPINQHQQQQQEEAQQQQQPYSSPLPSSPSSSSSLSQQQQQPDSPRPRPLQVLLPNLQQQQRFPPSPPLEQQQQQQQQQPDSPRPRPLQVLLPNLQQLQRFPPSPPPPAQQQQQQPLLQLPLTAAPSPEDPLPPRLPPRPMMMRQYSNDTYSMILRGYENMIRKTEFFRDEDS